MIFNKVAILGSGNLGFSIAQGLESAGLFTKDSMSLAEKNAHRKASIEAMGYNITDNSSEAVNGCDLIILVVKPWQIDELIDEIRDAIDPEKQVIASCVTGVTSGHIYKLLGQTMPFFRVMPNTGIAVKESMTCISSFNASNDQISSIDKLFSTLGQVIFIPEEQMPAATAIAGCGIAFALRFIRAAIQGGVEIGFGADDAKLMAAQIVKGAAELILENNSHPESEIDKVTTPKGVTITGLNEMEHAGFSSSIIRGILASYNKIEVNK
ncbi:pyrroline-5-carboxylate reductase [Saccharicrinis sp. FJH62]|uniref:pyrroline-5-carboxylate reductase n=1 Tax=Saccharicrinis sp. FJH62 TaxID=3344657 RepID=UPI0035D40790